MLHVENLVGVGVLALALAAACGSDVTSAAGGAGGTGASSGSSQIDPDCYDACIAKGESDAVCMDACTDDTKSASSKSTSVGSGGAGGGIDVELEKACYACWEDNADGACATEHDTCEKSLACVELRNCPFTCGSKPGCVDECNAIIPTGVEPLTELAQCIMCDAGPCATACAESIMQAYCE